MSQISIQKTAHACETQKSKYIDCDTKGSIDVEFYGEQAEAFFGCPLQNIYIAKKLDYNWIKLFQW